MYNLKCSSNCSLYSISYTAELYNTCSHHLPISAASPYCHWFGGFPLLHVISNIQDWKNPTSPSWVSGVTGFIQWFLYSAETPKAHWFKILYNWDFRPKGGAAQPPGPQLPDVICRIRAGALRPSPLWEQKINLDPNQSSSDGPGPPRTMRSM